MKIRNAILFLFVAAVAFASCKESEDNPVTTMNPTTEKILAEGLNIGAYGKDTTVLFPKADGYKIDISYATGSDKCVAARAAVARNSLSVVSYLAIGRIGRVFRISGCTTVGCRAGS